MKKLILTATLILACSHSLMAAEDVPTVTQQSPQLSALTQCRNEPSPLVRLACYDQASSPVGVTDDRMMGPGWRRAMVQEKGREAHSLAFLTRQSAGNNPTVIITTPAIGMPPPRPVLMFSCIDNITRMQVALVAPQKEGEGALTFVTDRTKFDTEWFVREEGFLLEASRGLAGIDEIKRLLDGETLAISSKQGAAVRLTFNISSLAEAIKPLRSACHW
ncbi:type VI secretion protein [Yersinia entomophaga]|uniref:Type VI secretion protein n=2 Tax=Yersinia TaxID=629 RepID=A0ABM6BG33_YERET|nr:MULTISPECIES: type VI secretion system-associated protein VasI [Yersinia]ANI28412.1 type VI secretion protein [Yersinia entomophaga]OWF85062.1 type VI secretion system-associated protein [Yersinia entomophaga]